MDTTKLSQRTLAMLPQLIEQAPINVPIYRVEETKTLIRVYLYGHRSPMVIRKPKTKRATT